MKEFKDLKVGNYFYAIHNEPYRVEEYKVVSEPMMQVKFVDPVGKKFMVFTASCRGEQYPFRIAESDWDESEYTVPGYDDDEFTTYYSDFKKFKACVDEKMDKLYSLVHSLESDMASMIGWMYN